MSNNRIHFGIRAMGIAPDGSTTYTNVHGLQSMGISTNYNLDLAQEIGQLQPYQLLEQVPDVEINTEKVLDGYPPVYCLATQQGTDASLAGRSNAKCAVATSIFTDTQNSASGNPICQLTCSGVFIGQVGFNFPTEGFFTENVTFLGTSKVWITSAFTYTGGFLNNDQPLAISSGAGGVQRRQNLIFGGPATTLDANGQVLATKGASRCTVLPPDIPGISASGTNDQTAGQYGCHVHNISVSANLGREPIYELGRRFYYFRYVSYPVQVSCDIEVTAHTGDLINVTEAGAAGSGLNLLNRSIRIGTQEGLFIDLGVENKLNSITQAGANVDGSNMTNTFNYVTYNNFTVNHLMDPAGF